MHLESTPQEPAGAAASPLLVRAAGSIRVSGACEGLTGMLPALDHVGVTRSGLRRGLGGVALLAALACLGGADAEAQYFGRNKVRYETYDFQVLRTEHFDIHYYSREREAAELAGRMAERWY